jgi:hypothetical protein
MNYLVKFLMVAEIEADPEKNAAIAHACARLDSFRESVLPSENYGVMLYRARPEDLNGDLLTSQVELAPQPD